MKREQQTFRRFIEQRRLRLTPQRELILAEFLRQERHITAEELYDVVKRQDRTIGQATVYRVLKLLCEAGLAQEVDFGDGVMRYEHQLGHVHHDHLICRGCGKTIELVDPEIEALQLRLAQRAGFELTDHKMYLYGRCKACRGD